MKRIFLFLATNLAIMTLLSVVLYTTGLDRYLQQDGMNPTGTLLACAVFGMGGAFISLAISKPMAKWTTKAVVLKEAKTAQELWLLNTVERLARSANLTTPELAIYDNQEPNAFATGATKHSSLIAISSGLLAGMPQDEIEAVLGHEMTHISNGDMVTLALLQGVLNTFVMFAARIVGQIIDKAVFRNDRGTGIGYFVTVMILQLILAIPATAIVCWFSRKREFKADAGSAALAGKRKMISALQRLATIHEVSKSALPEHLAAFGIIGMKKMFMTHPSLEARISALNAQRS